MAAPVVSINFKNIIAKIRKDNLLPENVLTKAINRGIRRSLYLMSNYAKEHHAYKDWKARARWELLHRGYGKGTGITKAIHFHSEKGKRNKRIQSGILYVDLQEAPWAKYQIEGTEGTSRPKFFFGRRKDPRDVYPTKDPVLAMKGVKGIEADDFLYNAVKKNKKYAKEFIEEEIEVALRRW